MCHIVLLMEYPTLNGGERSTLAFCEHLQTRGFHFSAIAPDGNPLTDALGQHNIRHIPFSFNGGLGQRLPISLIRESLATTLLDTGADVLHAISVSTSRIAGPVANKLRLPSIGHLRDIIRLSRQAINDINLNSVILAVSKATLTFHRAGGIHPTHSHVLYNGINLNLYRPKRPTGFIHRELDLPPGRKFIGAVGQITLRKGLDTLIHAFKEIASRNDDYHLLIAGQRHSQKNETYQHEINLKTYINQNGLSDRVHFLGFRDNMHDFYPELSLLTHCAHQEPLGRVLLEAAACGIPIIATAVGGTREIFPDSSFAILTQPGDRTELVTEIVRLISTPEQAVHLAERGRKKVAKTFDICIHAEKLAQHYHALF